MNLAGCHPTATGPLEQVPTLDYLQVFLFLHVKFPDAKKAYSTSILANSDSFINKHTESTRLVTSLAQLLEHYEIYLGVNIVNNVEMDKTSIFLFLRCKDRYRSGRLHPFGGHFNWTGYMFHET